MPGVLPPPAPADPEVVVDADVLDAVAADGVRDQEPARCADPPDALGGSPVQRPDQVGDAEPQAMRVAITTALTRAAWPSRTAAEDPLTPLRMGWSCRPTSTNRTALSR
jgi:hypothetical protein